MKITHKGWNLQDDGSYISGSTEDIMTPHKYKNRKHIYISSQNGLMYEDMYKGKRESPSFLGIVQKMTVLQELESFRRMFGTVTIKNMLIAILVSEIFRSKLESSINVNDVKIIKGTVITLSKLIIAVSEIERATSPLANEVNILEVTPPGAAAMIITPIANSGDTENNLTRINAIIGNKII